MFTQNLPPPPNIDLINCDANAVMDNINSILYDCGKAATTGNRSRDVENVKWQHIAQANDSKQIWNRIDWKGAVCDSDNDDSNVRPSDDDFKIHFEHLLNPPGTVPVDLSVTQGCPYVHLLDDDISPQEVDEALATLKTDKSGGPTGVPPGLLKWLPVDWIVTLTIMFNVIFFYSLCTGRMGEIKAGRTF